MKLPSRAVISILAILIQEIFYSCNKLFVLRKKLCIVSLTGIPSAVQLREQTPRVFTRILGEHVIRI